MQKQHIVDQLIYTCLRESNAIEDVWDDDSLKQAVLAWEYCVKQPVMTPKVVLKTHEILMAHHLFSDDLGKFRTCPVYIGGREGKPWFALPELMEQWCTRVNTSRTWKKDHCAYEDIHPFIDGNGRSGRIFMQWQRMKLGLPILVIKEQEKWAYYQWF